MGSLEDFVSRVIAISSRDADGSYRLPSERDMCAQLEISRSGLREHLASLENLGVLHRKPGRGTAIDTPDDSFVASYFTLMDSLGYLNEQQFTQARETLEESVAALAASLITEEDLDRLSQLVDDMTEHTAAERHDDALAADMAFHGELFRIVNNPIFNMMNAGLSQVLEENMRSRRALALAAERRSPDGSFNTDTVHYDIVAALRTHSPDLARAAMRKHFADFALLTLVAANRKDTQE